MPLPVTPTVPDIEEADSVVAKTDSGRRAGHAFTYLAGFLLSGLWDEPWRFMLIASPIPELVVFAFRVGMPESPLWLLL